MSSCFIEFILTIFFIWFIVIHPEIVSGLVSAMSQAFNLIVLLLTQIINAIH